MSEKLLTGRRAFVGAGVTALAATAVAGLSGGSAPAQTQGGSDVPNLYPGWNAREFKAIQKHENDHVAAFLAVLGSNARPKPTFRNLVMPDIKTFATVSRTLENTGVGAYTGAAPIVFSRANLAFAASVALIEGRHAGYLNSLLNLLHSQNVFSEEQSFERPLTINEVNDISNPFIASLNGGPPATFSPTPSRANDIAILNFALITEFLEAEFYNINVPRFFGS